MDPSISPAAPTPNRVLRAWIYALVIWVAAIACAIALTAIVGVDDETLDGQSPAGFGLTISLALTIVCLPLFAVLYLYWREARPPFGMDPDRRKRVLYVVGISFAGVFAVAFLIAAATDVPVAALTWSVATPAALILLRRELQAGTQVGIATASSASPGQVDVELIPRSISQLPPPPPSFDRSESQHPVNGNPSLGDPPDTESAMELRRVIRFGESQTLEFKSSARWNLHTGRVDKKIEHVITKSVCGFLNADGGTLLIGINDDGEPVGLRNDFKTVGKKQDRDHFELWLRQHLDANLSVHTAGLVQIRFELLDQHDVCVVDVTRSRKAIFARPSEGASGKATEFWVRSGNATNQLLGDDMIHYQSHHWGWWHQP